MALVTSVTYNSEIQFYEAIVRAKEAQATRQQATVSPEEAATDPNSFQSALATSMSNLTTAGNYGTNITISDTDMNSYFEKASNTYNVSIDLLKAIAKHESNFQPNVTSSAGAMGIMQLMPGTAAHLGVTDPYNAEQNIMGGAKLISELSSRYDGNLELTLAAYSAGVGAVAKYGGVPPYTETQNYIKSIKASLGIE